MGRKNVTEWRELIKRMIKRGELSMLDVAVSEDSFEDINEKLKELLGTAEQTVQTEPETEEKETASSDDDITALLRAVLENNGTPAACEPEYEEEPLKEPTRCRA